MTTTHEHDEMVDAKKVDVNPTDSEIRNSPSEVKPERVEPEPMDMEVADTQPEGEQFDSRNASEQAPTQTNSADIAHPEPLGEEVAYSPPVTSEHMHIPLEETEHFQTTSVVSEHMHPEVVSSEIVHSEPVSTEMVHSVPVSEEMVHTHMVTQEMVHSLSDAEELVHTQPISADFMYTQPVSSELVHSQPLDSEFVHSQPVDQQNGTMQQLHLQPVELISSQGVGMELVSMTQPLNTQPLNTEIPNSLQATPDIQPGKRRKKKSIVWEHFTIETVSAGCRRACCKVCKQSFAYSTGSKVAGTSHLKRHIAKGTCPVILRQQEKNQLSPYLPKSGGTETTSTVQQPKRRYRTAGSPYLIFDQDRCRHEIARMIIMHDYPLHMVEHPGFVSFVQNLQPRFDMVSFNIVQGDCVATFLREKQNLQKFVEGIPGRICLTLDMWSSTQSTGYVFVTGQFIDNDWKLHRRLLNVVMEPFPESDSAFSHAIGTCLSDWGLDRKLASITFKQPLSETGLEKLRALLAVKNPLLFNGQFLIKGCIAHTLSSMAQEVLEGGRETIRKIRTSVKYVKTVESHEEKFLELKEQLQVPSEKSLSLDNVTKWNTTYEMLFAASELKQVFSCLDTSDPNYTDAPSMEDWKEIENVCMFLKLLHDTAILLTTKTVPSSHVFFHEVWKIQLELARAGASDDLFVSGMAKILQDKFHKYFKNACLILAIAVAMDPRFKMKLVEFSFTKIFIEEAPVYIRVVDDGMHELFHEYMTLPMPPTPGEDGNGINVKSEDQQGSNGLTDFDMYIMETTSQQMKSELDQYLEESLLPRVHDFDVLGWWKLNKIKYPTLSKMARDILSVPLSTVASDSVFDTVPKEMDSYRCSLRSETVEALICAKDWLQQTTPTVSTQLVKMEL
ncbi:hypothetical protein RND81_08G066300 [Saponaria officinalis]|uniref:BED-type domain-containing protein n=1 Tax=Saponaria officinalis TaxID=3572 RepID=A0AAW1J4L3_SAPOF